MSKLYQLIKSLSPAEKKRFDKYLASPFFTNGNLIVIWEIVKHVGKKIPTDTEIAEQLYPDKQDKAKSAAFVRKDKSALYKCLVQFLAHCLLLEDGDYNQRFQLQALSMHDQEKECETVFMEQKQQFESQKCMGLSQYEADYWLHKNYYNHLLATNNRHRQANNLRLLVVRKFDLYYAASQITWLINLLIGNDVIYPLSVQETTQIRQDAVALVSFIESKNFLTEPIIKAYYHLAHLFLQESPEKHLNNLQQWIEQHVQDAQREDLALIFKFASIYCINEFKKGRADFIKHINYFYGIRIKWQFLPEGKYFVPADFKNIVTLKCHLQHLDEAADFVENYSHLLPPEHASLKEYFKGQIAFYKKDFKTAAHFLEQVDKKDNIDYLQVNTLLIRSYFGLLPQLVYSELLENKLKAYKTRLAQMVRQKNIPPSTQKNENGFISYCERLFWVLENTDSKRQKKTAIAQIEAEIANNSTCSNKEWLLLYCKEKIERL